MLDTIEIAKCAQSTVTVNVVIKLDGVNKLLKIKKENSLSYCRSPNEIPKTEEDERLYIDPNNIEASYAFTDAKRKLRLVLSIADFSMSPYFTEFGTPLGTE